MLRWLRPGPGQRGRPRFPASIYLAPGDVGSRVARDHAGEDGCRAGGHTHLWRCGDQGQGWRDQTRPSARRPPCVCPAWALPRLIPTPSLEGGAMPGLDRGLWRRSLGCRDGATSSTAQTFPTGPGTKLYSPWGLRRALRSYVGEEVWGQVMGEIESAFRKIWLHACTCVLPSPSTIFGFMLCLRHQRGL